MTTTKRSPREQALLNRIGAELRDIRERAQVPQQAVADLFGWHRDAISKIETGKSEITLPDYLSVMDFMREFAPPTHPGVALHDYLNRRPLRLVHSAGES